MQFVTKVVKQRSSWPAARLVPREAVNSGGKYVQTYEWSGNIRFALWLISTYAGTTDYSTSIQSAQIHSPST